MRDVIKSNFKHYFFSTFIIALGIVLYVVVNTSDAEPLAQQDDGSSNTHVSIPPPIAGLAPYRDSEALSFEIAPLSILTSHGEELNFTVEVAVTAEQHKNGLMFRASLDENAGMLFLFKESGERAFWMKNTLIPLDMIFVRADGVIHHIHENAMPKSLERIFSAGPVKAVLELAGGEVDRLGLTIGDRLMFPYFNSKPSKE